MTIKSRRQSSAKLRHLLLEKHNHTCVLCGVTDDVVPLEIASIVPISEGGEISEENFTVLCPNCHRSFDKQPREHELISFLSEIINAKNSYDNVKIEPLLGRQTRYRADLIVDRLESKSKETLLIECKSYLIGSMAGSKKIINQLKKYKDVYGDCQMILAVPGTLKDRELKIFSAEKIEVWDLGYIAHNLNHK